MASHPWMWRRASALLAFVLLLGGCAAPIAPVAPLPTRPAPSATLLVSPLPTGAAPAHATLTPSVTPTKTPSPTVLPPSATAARATPLPTSSNAEGSVVFELAPASEQPMLLVVTTDAGDTLFDTTIEAGAPYRAALPPGAYRYRATQIFEPLEPTPCYQSVVEGPFTLQADTEPRIELYNGYLSPCPP